MNAPQPDEHAALPEHAATVESPSVGRSYPRTVIVAIALWVVSALLYFASAILLIIQHNDLIASKTAEVQKGSSLTQDQIVSVLSRQLYLLEVCFFVFAAVTVAFVVALWGGRTWSRIAFWILAAIQLLIVLFLGGTLFTYIATLFGLIAIALLTMPSASAYLRPVKPESDQ